jgi:ribosomal protein S12 methylthiotransferase accessory factor YcaO
MLPSLGKGLTRAQAKVSALMESLEGFHAEEIRLPVVRDTVRQSRYLGSYRAISSCDRLRATKRKT